MTRNNGGTPRLRKDSPAVTLDETLGGRREQSAEFDETAQRYHVLHLRRSG